MNILSTHMDVGALGLFHSGDQIGIRGADNHLAACVLHGGDSSSTRTAASEAVLFIFQLPAMIALRFALSMILYLLYLPSIVQKALHKQKDAAALKPPHHYDAGIRLCVLNNCDAGAAPCPPDTPEKRRRRWRCGSILSPRPICCISCCAVAAANHGGSIALSHSLGNCQSASCQSGVSRTRPWGRSTQRSWMP